MILFSPRHKRWPGALFRPPGQFGPQHLIFYWPIRGHLDICQAIIFKIMLARTITKYIFRAGARLTSRQFLCGPFATPRRQRESDLPISPAVWRSRDTSMRTSVASGHFSSTSTYMCKQFCRMYGDFRSVNLKY